MAQKLFPLIGFLGLLMLGRTASGQSCACPSTCSPCSNGLTQITLQFNGDARSLIVIKEGPNTVFSSQVFPGDLISLSGSLSNGRFQSASLDITVNGKGPTKIDTNCKPTTAVNERIGSFVIVAGKNINGTALCCRSGSDDRVAPRFVSAPSDISVDPEFGKCGANVSWANPEVADCNLDEIEINHSSGSFFPVGTTEVRIRAIDKKSNRTERTFKVTVRDTNGPVFTSCPNDITVVIPSGTKTDVTWTRPQAVDNCSTPTVTSTHSPGSHFHLGTTRVTYTATDQSGNSAQCSFNVIVVKEGVNPPDGGDPDPDDPDDPDDPGDPDNPDDPDDPDNPDDPGTNPPPLTSPPPTGPGEEVDIIISRVVTPNGDGINDVWTITNIEKFDNDVVITDRWGGVVFTGKNYDNERVVWDGKVRGGLAPLGTYFYSITYRKGERYVKVSGFIELIP